MIRGLFWSSFFLLFLSSFDDGLVGVFAKLLWILSFLFLCYADLGAGLGICIISIAIYNSKHAWAPGPIYDRVDNLALIMLFLILLFRRIDKRKFLEDKTIIALFFLFTLIPLATIFLKGQGDWFTFAEYFRMFGIPLTTFLFLWASDISEKESESFFRSMTLLGLYMAIVSILESLNLRSLLVPPWIGDPHINGTIGEGRAGGLIMQSEFNGLALALIVILICANLIKNRKYSPSIEYAGLGIALIGIYLTYTRAVWVSIFIGFIILLTGLVSIKISPIAKIGAAILFAAAVFVAVSIPSPMAKARFEDSGTINYRLHLWARSIQMGMERPFFGHGITQFESSVTEYESNLSSIPEVFIPKRGTGTHNLVLNLFVEQGIVGLALFVMIVFRFYRIVGRNLSRLNRNHEKYWILAFAAVYFVNAQFINMHETTTNMIFYGALGMMAGMIDVSPWPRTS